MHRIDGPGATVTNQFTEGNPALGIPATVVTDDIMNDIQEEIITPIEQMGITLVKGTQDQLFNAINEMIARGGSESQETIANNQATPANLTSLLFDKATIKGAQVSFEIYRQTDSANLQENGTAFISHRTATDTWEITFNSVFDDAGVTLSITSAGQVQYTSSNVAGASYTGTMRITGIQKFRQTLV